MPEGDVVFRTAARLHDVFAGQPLVGAELRWPGLSERSLHGMVTTEIVAAGKHVLHRLDSGLTIHSHLRMDGRWRVRPTSTMRPAAVTAHTIRALLATSQWTAIGYSLGMLDVIWTSEESSAVGHLGPDLLGADWDEDEALRRLLEHPNREIAAALLDQRNLAGMGTIFASEPLFVNRVNPWQPVGSIDEQRLREIMRTGQAMLKRSVAKGFSITERSNTAEESYVFSRKNRPCLRCGTIVQMQEIGPPTQQRPMSFCPTCQPLVSTG